MREDQSADGDAWSSFPHDHARSRQYRWGEDGLAGFSDDRQRLCVALAVWNGEDPILKERLFGLTNAEGNHGEDVKEYYYYLDATPTHSYMRYLYKYPLRCFPYQDLVSVNARRSRSELEYELLDTGAFDGDRYVDIEVEFAKASPEDVCCRASVYNRATEPATLHVLPQVWYRATWLRTPAGSARPSLRKTEGAPGTSAVLARHPELGSYTWSVDGPSELLFTENETNTLRLFGTPPAQPYVKDAFHRWLVDGERGAVNPELRGTKAAAHIVLRLPALGSAVAQWRLASGDRPPAEPFGEAFASTFEARRQEADEFYAEVLPDVLGTDERLVCRQALAGMIWTKQYYEFDLASWLEERGAGPFAPHPRPVRNRQWFHMDSHDVISMPDKWEYPWFAAWDLAFHTGALALTDVEFAKAQVELCLTNPYLHPSGQVPAYEWNFGDVNPPVHAWATMFVYQYERQQRGRGDLDFLRRCFRRLQLNFTWWVNRKDPSGRNVFEGGFLGLDNIGVFNRSAPLPTGGYLEQADGTAWMALFCQNMLEIALELAAVDETYTDIAEKFVEHFLWIASAMDRIGESGEDMWDDEDGFFYDVMRLPDGRAQQLKVRSVVGLLPLCAATVVDGSTVARFPQLAAKVQEFLGRYPEAVAKVHPLNVPGALGNYLLAVCDEHKLRAVLRRMLDESEFLSPYGIRSLSAAHRDQPFSVWVHGEEYGVSYLPAESDSGMFGGNSNWRGPVWLPVQALLVRSLLHLYRYYGDELLVECPTGSGNLTTLYGVASDLCARVARIFLRDDQGRRPVFGGSERFQTDPHWRDLLLFYEYFHGDNGAGLGASHQTGWTGLVARLLQMFAVLTPESYLSTERTYGPVAMAAEGRPG